MIVGLLLWQDWRTTLLLLVLALPLALMLRNIGKRLEHTTSLSQDAFEQVSSHLQEGFKHHPTIRALD
jgi:ABC-type multidrug transport system fused ATPase/permease subunit